MSFLYTASSLSFETNVAVKSFQVGDEVTVDIKRRKKSEIIGAKMFVSFSQLSSADVNARFAALDFETPAVNTLASLTTSIDLAGDVPAVIDNCCDLPIFVYSKFEVCDGRRKRLNGARVRGCDVGSVIGQTEQRGQVKCKRA